MPACLLCPSAFSAENEQKQLSIINSQFPNDGRLISSKYACVEYMPGNNDFKIFHAWAEGIQDQVSCFKEFNCFPFDQASPALWILATVSYSSHTSILQEAKQDGQTQEKTFISECISSKEKNLHKWNSCLLFTEIPIRAILIWGNNLPSNAYYKAQVHF